MHNLLFGKPYVDASGKCTIRNINRPDNYAELNFTKRGWTADNAYRVDG